MRVQASRMEQPPDTDQDALLRQLEALVPSLREIIASGTDDARARIESVFDAVAQGMYDHEQRSNLSNLREHMRELHEQAKKVIARGSQEDYKKIEAFSRAAAALYDCWPVKLDP
jgi:uncharacterized phage infection (PIP) family protein YhgE